MAVHAFIAKPVLLVVDIFDDDAIYFLVFIFILLQTGISNFSRGCQVRGGENETRGRSFL